MRTATLVGTEGGPLSEQVIRMHRTSSALAALGAVALTLMAPSAAMAGQPFDKGHVEFTDSFDDTLCGIAVHFEVSSSAKFVNHPVKGSDGQAFLNHNNYEFTEVISTDAGFVTTHGNGNFLEQKATHIAGDVWEFESLDAGTFRVYDASGDLLARANGVVKAREQFDTLGDSQPGGEPVPGTFELLVEHGQTLSDDEFCAAVLPELT